MNINSLNMLIIEIFVGLKKKRIFAREIIMILVNLKRYLFDTHLYHWARE